MAVGPHDQQVEGRLIHQLAKRGFRLAGRIAVSAMIPAACREALAEASPFRASGVALPTVTTWMSSPWNSGLRAM